MNYYTAPGHFAFQPSPGQGHPNSAYTCHRGPVQNGTTGQHAQMPFTSAGPVIGSSSQGAPFPPNHYDQSSHFGQILQAQPRSALCDRTNITPKITHASEGSVDRAVAKAKEAPMQPQIDSSLDANSLAALLETGLDEGQAAPMPMQAAFPENGFQVHHSLHLFPVHICSCCASCLLWPVLFVVLLICFRSSLS